MGYVEGNLAKEAGRLHDWRETFWPRRYRAINVNDAPEVQIARLRYGVREGWQETCHLIGVPKQRDPAVAPTQQSRSRLEKIPRVRPIRTALRNWEKR